MSVEEGRSWGRYVRAGSREEARRRGRVDYPVLVVAGVIFFGLAYLLGGRDGHGPWFQFAVAPTMVSFLVAEYWMGRVTTTTPPPVAERLVLAEVVVWTMAFGILLALGRPKVPMVALLALPFAARRLVRRLFR